MMDEKRDELKPEDLPTLSSAATQLSFAAAADQLRALSEFGPRGSDAVSAEDRERAVARRRKEYESTFIRDGAIRLDSNGLLEFVAWSHAVEAIRAKALALGYGALSQTVPITSVPGGYVGRFGGNDIYAAAR
jgi:hypothetical protein